jgi:tetratricopeptide (TPR) repeat protein
VLLDDAQVDALVLLARLDVRAQHPERAIARLLSLAERLPAEPAALELLHPLLLWAGDATRGLEIFTRAEERLPESGQAQEALGDFLASLGREQEALDRYRRALALDPARHGAELKAVRILGTQIDELLRRLPPAAPAPDPRVGVPAAPDAAHGAR